MMISAGSRSFGEKERFSGVGVLAVSVERFVIAAMHFLVWALVHALAAEQPCVR